jgi:hypothetical protein
MVMNRFTMIAATGALALLLTGCGDNSKPEDKGTDTAVVVPTEESSAAPAADAAPAAEAAPAEAAPAEAAPAEAAPAEAAPAEAAPAH